MGQWSEQHGFSEHVAPLQLDGLEGDGGELAQVGAELSQLRAEVGLGLPEVAQGDVQLPLPLLQLEWYSE